MKPRFFRKEIMGLSGFTFAFLNFRETIYRQITITRKSGISLPVCDPHLTILSKWVLKNWLVFLSPEPPFSQSMECPIVLAQCPVWGWQAKKPFNFKTMYSKKRRGFPRFSSDLRLDGKITQTQIGWLTYELPGHCQEGSPDNYSFHTKFILLDEKSAILQLTFC